MKIWIKNQSGRPGPPKYRERFERLVARIKRMGIFPKDALELSVLLVDDGTIRQANRVYRKKDRPTDVLSFPNKERNKGMDDDSLGDIMIGLDVARRQAREYGVTLSGELDRLVVHGILHLCGHDHMKKREREAMEDLENRILGGRR